MKVRKITCSSGPDDSAPAAPPAAFAVSEDAIEALRGALATHLETYSVPRHLLRAILRDIAQVPALANTGVDPEASNGRPRAGVAPEAVAELRADLDRSYPQRAPYDVVSTTIDRLDAILELDLSGSIDHRVLAS
ncbi:hypothetical protein ACFV9C_41825 [Kribbella sp. NPDC059898]|uniref:hypothetical protein n=1 Tax=Kribbella sp. NPDC059898 TaxID=3346995 RepID=UPI00365E9A6B